MASTFTDLGLELMATGENAGTWGTKTNANLQLIEQLTGGVLSISIAGGAGNQDLTIAEGALTGTAQQRILEFTGTISGARVIRFPLLTETFYFIKNGTSGAHTVQVKAVSGSGATVTFAADDKGYKIIYFDGVATNTGAFEVPLTTAGTVTETGTQTLTNKTINASQLVDGSIATAKLADDLVTLAKMAPGTDGNIISYDASGNPVAVATGSSGQVLTSAGAGAPPTFAAVDSGRTGTVSWDTTVKTSGFTGANGIGYFCNTAGGAFTLTLPSSPSAGDIVGLKDYNGNFSTAALTIGRGGSKINGENDADPSINTDGASIFLVYVDSTQGWVATQDDSSTFSGASFVCASVSGSGNAISTSGTCKIATFTGPGTFTVNSVSSTAANNVVSYMIVAGGAGGGYGAGSHSGAGGGAGGFRETKSPATPYSASPLDGYGTPGNRITVSAQGYPIAIGGGGAASTGSGSKGSSGVNTSAFGLTSAGGGGGGSPGSGARPGADGGSGGGGASEAAAPGGSGNTPPTTPSQGFGGGTGTNSPPDLRTGGGGGASAAGGNGTPGSVSGNGGAGGTTGINPAVSSAFAGGGGGGSAGPSGQQEGGAGGAGGGGIGGQHPGGAAGGAGTANTGGGGGGGGFPGLAGGAGGSGIVIIRYRAG